MMYFFSCSCSCDWCDRGSWSDGFEGRREETDEEEIAGTRRRWLLACEREIQMSCVRKKAPMLPAWACDALVLFLNLIFQGAVILARPMLDPYLICPWVGPACFGMV